MGNVKQESGNQNKMPKNRETKYNNKITLSILYRRWFLRVFSEECKLLLWLGWQQLQNLIVQMNTLKISLDKKKTLNSLLWFEKEWKVELAYLVEDMFQYTVFCCMWNKAGITIFSLKVGMPRKIISSNSVSYSSKK